MRTLPTMSHQRLPSPTSSLRSDHVSGPTVLSVSDSESDKGGKSVTSVYFGNTDGVGLGSQRRGVSPSTPTPTKPCFMVVLGPRHRIK